MAGSDLRVPKDHRLQAVDVSVHKVDVLRRHSVGMKAWVLHRITGVGLLLYLMAHIATMGTAMFLGEEAFKRTFEILFHTPIFVVFDLFVLAAVILHALNGIRLVLIDMGYFITKQKVLFNIMFVLSSILFLWLISRAFL
ncbi:succinate dehydrogenase, cytochrome b556 subunit [Ammoniphilus sp. CFH 90114]|uniref:succinate dehydrogenase, cytochrome b556 subunit n=1 Tax=Ammoniphilus sp. CFH 90114 TaxID=2493665 RepID=UPI00100E4107|nr:succinate dehydrogenase, cytochrome b556 subunit [Ammoniphilus sp. CFH 90114]RXT07208.1 succinate dehydrogenase, cytochrome b556 subunit [Ammoniphilus sp. CFH 90114]